MQKTKWDIILDLIIKGGAVCFVLGVIFEYACKGFLHSLSSWFALAGLFAVIGGYAVAIVGGIILEIKNRMK